MENQVQVQNQEQDKSGRMATVLAVGAGIGAVVGLLASYIFLKNIDEADDKEFTPMIGVQLGLGVIGLLRILAG